MSKVWFITGASRGLGLEFVKKALENGDKVVASARNPESLSNLTNENLFPVKLDVTDENSIKSAVSQALEHFGHIDILVNNAGYGLLAHFEELSADSINQQFATNVFGAFNVTRAILPTMRKQKSGKIINISSLVGIIGIDGSSIYCATKGALTSWSESLSLELADFNIDVTLVHPGGFRTDFVDPSSVKLGDFELPDYEAKRHEKLAGLETFNHAQPGNPVKLADLLLEISKMENPPIRIAAGTDSLEAFEERAAQLTNAVKSYSELSKMTDY